MELDSHWRDNPAQREFDVKDRPTFPFRLGGKGARGNAEFIRLFPRPIDHPIITYREFPEIFPTDEARALALKNTPADQAELHRTFEKIHDDGRKIYVHSFEASAFDLSFEPSVRDQALGRFYKAHPGVRPAGGWRAMYCPSNPVTFQFVAGQVPRAFTDLSPKSTASSSPSTAWASSTAIARNAATILGKNAFWT